MPKESLIVAYVISIHSPRMGRDVAMFMLFYKERISIHSPRMGRDICCALFCSRISNFNPLSPHGERLTCAGICSYH